MHLLLSAALRLGLAEVRRSGFLPTPAHSGSNSGTNPILDKLALPLLGCGTVIYINDILNAITIQIEV